MLEEVYYHGIEKNIKDKGDKIFMELVQKEKYCMVCNNAYQPNSNSQKKCFNCRNKYFLKCKN